MRSVPRFRWIVAGLVVAIAAAVFGIVWWKQSEREREIERLRRAVAHLTASYPIARLVVVDRGEAAGGEAATRVRLWFLDEQGRRLGEARETELPGERIYFEALVIVFEDPLVAAGERRALAFPTRLFTESVGPRDGYPLEALDDDGVPRLVDRGKPPAAAGLSAGEYREVLRRFWELANDPPEAAGYGIDVVQGQAVFTDYQRGRFYSIFVEADGGLTIRPELHWLE